MSQATQDPAEGLSRASLQRLTSFLLVVAAALLTAVIALSLYILWDKRELAELKGSLLAQRQLQEELLANQDSDNAPYPHLVPGISYVLNPAMQQATWKTGEHQPYHINRIGLRGREIQAKPNGVKRIALVGDSVLFGWKLSDEDRLENLLQNLVDNRLGAGKYEFVTIAIPGWNIIDQERFLRSHLARLNPDYIVWSIIRNDLLDSGGVIPPGMLAAWNSPHKELEQPFQFLPPALLRDAPAPEILSRWQTNLRVISEFSGEHHIPTSLLWWRARHRATLDYAMAGAGIELPVLYVPGQYRYDDGNWCVAFPDCHPTRWANERLAIAVLGELASQGVMASLSWDQGEQAVLDAFDKEQERSSTPAEQQAYMEEQAARIPDHYSPAAPGGVVFGVHESKMQRNGLILLRRNGAATGLALEVAPLWMRPGPPLQLDIRVKSGDNRTVESSYTLDKPSTLIEMNLPPGANFGVYQIEWLFSYSECERPSACFSAELKSARLLE